LTLYSNINNKNEIVIESYVDAAYGVHVNSGKSHTGAYVTIGRGVILAVSNKQKIVSKSSTEAELIGLSDFTSEVLWLRNFLIDQRHVVKNCIIYQDNKSVISLIKNGRSKSSHMKHVNIRYFFMKDYTDNGIITIKYLPTDDMVSDVLTKPLQGFKYQKFMKILMNII
jgi:hypothetical protein